MNGEEKILCFRQTIVSLSSSRPFSPLSPPFRKSEIAFACEMSKVCQIISSAPLLPFFSPSLLIFVSLVQQLTLASLKGEEKIEGCCFSFAPGATTTDFLPLPQTPFFFKKKGKIVFLRLQNRSFFLSFKNGG